ncbi:MAG: TRAP transporter substrate-binding protein [Xanthomonadales bacterium]|nr:TRAP transporter substrate-binding protein [Xanthomonadales bacterium]
MKRREFLTKTGIASAGALSVAACAQSDCEMGEAASQDEAREWKMVTSWPRNFPGLGTGAARLAESVTQMSGGRLTVKIYGAGDLVPAFEVFDAVSRGTAEMGHAAAYYWKGKSEAAQFFGSVPFGLNAQEMNGWLYFGGGLELWRELYEPFGLVPFPAGNSGVQMGGWFNKEINSVADLEGLKMRIPGLGGEVLRRAGGTPVNLPGSELFTALQSGTIDATEWVGPYNDRAFGLFQAARYYYYPGWHEPGTTLECMVNKEAFDALPDDLKAIVENACAAENDRMLAEFTANNREALKAFRDNSDIEIRRFPEEVLTLLQDLSDDVVKSIAATEPMAQRIFDSFVEYRDSVRDWQQLSEVAYFSARD